MFQKFLDLNIDPAPIGFERREDNTPYFCTPKGASVFGWAGVDGIHFCFIRGFGEMVFAVSPMNTAPNYVHPLARSFTDFLRLLLVCGDTAALEQAWMWDEAEFLSFLRENLIDREQKRLLSLIAEYLHLTPMEHPWAYIRELQDSFDYSKIKYTEDFYDLDMAPHAEPAVSDWKVYFNGNFWGHRGKDRAGTEVPLETAFTWAGHSWILPAVYACGRGLVADLCMRVEPEDICAFIEKWITDPANCAHDSFTREQQMQMEAENPFNLPFTPRLEVNGKILQASHGCSVSFSPCVSESFPCEPEAKWVVAHYGLDNSFGWVIYRYAFPWKTRRRPELHTLSLSLKEQPRSMVGPHFQAHRAGDSVVFTHPISKTAYTLTVREWEQQTIPPKAFRSDEWIFPMHMVVMRYTLSPESDGEITVCDCAESDMPIPTAQETGTRSDEAAGSAVIGIIGGADGPTVLQIGPVQQDTLHTACSSLHFELIEGDIEWRITFHVRQFDELSIKLL